MEWVKGEWYLAATCRNCGVQFAFQPDGEIDESTYFTDRGRIVVTCPNCRFPMDYSGEEIKRVEAQD